MQRQCNGCFKLGHLKWECKNEKMNWKGYVDLLRSTGNFEDVLFGSWLEPKKDDDERKKAEDPKEKPKEKPRTPSGDLRDLLDNPENLKKAMAAFIAKNGRNASQRRRSPNRGRSRSRSRDRQSPRRSRNQSPKRNRSRSPDYRGHNYKKRGWNNRRGNHYRRN